METAVGVDVGATLAKVAVRAPGRSPEFRLLPTDALGEVAAAVGEARPQRVGVTGGGAAQLVRLLDRDVARIDEFAAWGAGAATLLAQHGASWGGRYLLVSVGTGTSALLVDGSAVRRVGGTALGGGTLLGLGAALVGSGRFGQLAKLAAHGKRARVDLLVADIYGDGEIPLAGELTASNFGKLARLLEAGEAVAREDLAHAIVGLVAENVALVCGGIASTTRVSRIVFAGSTLRTNPAFTEILDTITRAFGREPVLLPKGEFAGSLGALLLAAREAREAPRG